MIISIANGLTRETLIASKLYNYFKLSKGSLLTIITELKRYKLSVSLDIQIKDTKLSIENTLIKSISLNNNEKIILNLKNTTIRLDDFSNIKNIRILSDNFPQSNIPLRKINKKDIIRDIKSHKKYNKIVEEYHKLIDVEYSESEERITTKFDDFINDMLKEKVNNKDIIEKVNLYLINSSKIK